MTFATAPSGAGEATVHAEFSTLFMPPTTLNPSAADLRLRRRARNARLFGSRNISLIPVNEAIDLALDERLLIRTHELISPTAR